MLKSPPRHQSATYRSSGEMKFDAAAYNTKRSVTGEPINVRKSRTRSSSSSSSSGRCCCLPVSKPVRFRSVSPRLISAAKKTATLGKSKNIVLNDKTVLDKTNQFQQVTRRTVTTANVHDRTIADNVDSASFDQNIVQLSNRMQLLRFENNAKCCRKLLKHNGHPNKIFLYPEESWARNASTTYWTLFPVWWNCGRCKVVEIVGTKTYTTYAKMSDMSNGNLHISGSFKKCPDPDFKKLYGFHTSSALDKENDETERSIIADKWCETFFYYTLTLSSNVTIADFNMGYCMTGSLERGCRKLNNYQITHFAVVKRAEFNK